MVSSSDSPALGKASPSMSTNALNSSGWFRGQGDGAGSAHRPACDSPTGPVGTHAEVRHDVGDDLLRQVIGCIAPAAVDALGVVGEAARSICEHEHRRISPVIRGEVVDDPFGSARPEPVLGGAELSADHHHRGQHRGWAAPEPRGRKIDQFVAVPEARCGVGRADLHDGAAVGGHLPAQSHAEGRVLVDLPWQRLGRQLIPAALDGGHVAGPEVQRQRDAHQRRGHGQHRKGPPPPRGARPTDEQDAHRETGGARPTPRTRPARDGRRRCRSAGRRGTLLPLRPARSQPTPVCRSGATSSSANRP